MREGKLSFICAYTTQYLKVPNQVLVNFLTLILKGFPRASFEEIVIFTGFAIYLIDIGQ
jgi:hypothetical protein